jgi:hypothetical protein
MEHATTGFAHPPLRSVGLELFAQRQVIIIQLVTGF